MRSAPFPPQSMVFWQLYTPRKQNKTADAERQEAIVILWQKQHRLPHAMDVLKPIFNKKLNDNNRATASELLQFAKISTASQLLKQLCEKLAAKQSPSTLLRLVNILNRLKLSKNVSNSAELCDAKHGTQDKHNAVTSLESTEKSQKQMHYKNMPSVIFKFITVPAIVLTSPKHVTSIFSKEPAKQDSVKNQSVTVVPTKTPASLHSITAMTASTITPFSWIIKLFQQNKLAEKQEHDEKSHALITSKDLEKMRLYQLQAHVYYRSKFVGSFQKHMGTARPFIFSGLVMWPTYWIYRGLDWPIFRGKTTLPEYISQTHMQVKSLQVGIILTSLSCIIFQVLKDEYKEIQNKSKTQVQKESFVKRLF